MKPTQYLLVGLPYSGKTTLAKGLKSQLGFAHINIDQLKAAAGYGNAGDDEVPDEAWDEIFKRADELIVKYLRESKNLANEYAWVTRSWRDRARKIASDAGFDTKVIYLKIGLEEIKGRWRKNQQTQERFDWPESEFQAYIRDFQRPTLDENVMIYDQTISIKEWIESNFEQD